jgi:hypothetical protein
MESAERLDRQANDKKESKGRCHAIRRLWLDLQAIQAGG